MQRVEDGPDRFASYWHQIDLVLSTSPERVLEIGGGNGFLAGYLRRAGMDVTTVETADRLAFPDASFDAVIAFDVLAARPWSSFVPSLREMARVSSSSVGISLPDVERVLRFESSMGKLWSFRFLVPFPRLFPPPPPAGGDGWRIGTKGLRHADVLRAIREAGLEPSRDWRAFELPEQHFFRLAKRAR